VKSIAEMGAYVSLFEYDNIEGMILLSELSRRRICSISKLICVGRQEVVVVLRVDKEKGYIDLSKRRVSAEEIAKCEEKYQKSKAVHSIMRHVAETMHMPLDELYSKFGWKLYRKYGHAYDGFKRAISDPEEIFKDVDFSAELKEAFLKNIRRRMAPQPSKIRSDIEVTCFRYEGIDAIKEALLAGQACGTEDVPVKIKLVAPPLYVMVTASLEKDKGIQVLNKAIEAIRTSITAKKGELQVKVPPRAVSERDERELATMLEDAARANAEVSGDDDDQEEEDKKSGSEADSDDDSEEEAAAKGSGKPTASKGKDKA